MAKSQKAPKAPRESAQGGVQFSEEEKAAIVKACTKYRQMIPIYLAARQAEAAVIDAVIVKLTKNSQS